MSSPKPNVPEPAVQIHLTPSFAADFADLRREDAAAAATIANRLSVALEEIQGNNNPNLPISRYGRFGDSFSYELSPQYLFTFKMATDRDSEGHALVYHYYLKNLLLR